MKILSLLNYFFNSLTRLHLDNFNLVASCWKKILFYIAIDYKTESELLEKECPSNLIFSLKGIEIVDIKKIHPSIKYLDCPIKIIQADRNVSDSLVYLNMTEQLHIPTHLDFSGKSLKYLDLSFTDLLNVDLSFTKNLKVVNLMGVINLINLEGFGYVEKLNIDYCELIEDLTPLKNIKFLSMKYNTKIKKIPFLAKLKVLNISFTVVEDISELINIEKNTFRRVREDIYSTKKTQLYSIN